MEDKNEIEGKVAEAKRVIAMLSSRLSAMGHVPKGSIHSIKPNGDIEIALTACLHPLDKVAVKEATKVGSVEEGGMSAELVSVLPAHCSSLAIDERTLSYVVRAEAKEKPKRKERKKDDSESDSEV